MHVHVLFFKWLLFPGNFCALLRVVLTKSMIVRIFLTWNSNQHVCSFFIIKWNSKWLLCKGNKWALWQTGIVAKGIHVNLQPPFFFKMDHNWRSLWFWFLPAVCSRCFASENTWIPEASKLQRKMKTIKKIRICIYLPAGVCVCITDLPHGKVKTYFAVEENMPLGCLLRIF